MNEPIRMQESEELPSALRAAFGALGQDAPSEETVLRVQRALSALPPAAPGAAAAGTLALGKLLVVVSLVAAGLASAVVLTRRPPSPRAERASAAIPAAETRAPAEPARALQANAPARAATGQGAPAAEPGLLSAPGAQPGADEPTHTLPTSARRGIAARAAGAARFAPRTSRAYAPSQLSATQGARADERAAPSSAEALAPADQGSLEPEAALHDDQVPSASPPPARVAHAQTSEAQRLAQCKRLALHDPLQALREVEALAEQLPNGALGQERELLAIRLHEQLGHHATALELRQRFLERYPSSVYRRALAP